MDSKYLLSIAAVAVVAILLCTYAFAPHQDQKDDNTELIGIIGAMEVEVEKIREAMDVQEKRTISGMDYYIGTLDNQRVVLTQCGMGKVNAGICAQAMITCLGVTAVINTGASGSLDNSQNIGDFVVSSEVIQHDFDATPLGFAKGEVPYTGKYAFDADKTLIEKAKRAIEVCIPEVKCTVGRICTGDQFISTNEQKDRIISDYGGLCCEMEGGAVGYVCYVNKVPFVIIRAISDKADGSDMMDYPEFERLASYRCAKIVNYMLTNWEALTSEDV